MDSEQQICLKWNHHKTVLVEIFNKLLSNVQLVDCTLAAEGQYMKVHQIILSACSPYFELLLSQHIDKHPIIILKDVTFRELKAIVDYMYQGELNVLSQDQLGALLKVAKNLQIKGLSDSGGVGTEPKEKPPEKRQFPLPPPPPDQQPSTIILRPGLTIEHRSSNQLDVFQRSPSAFDISQVSRKRKRTRRRSSDNELSLYHTHIGSHNNSTSREYSSLRIPPNVASTPVSNPFAVIPDQPAVLDSTDLHILPEPAQVTHQDIVHKTEPNKEMLLKPKHEYLDDYRNEDSVENLFLEDDMNDLGESQAGPSGEESSGLGFTPRHMTSDRSTDENFMQAQKFVGDQRGLVEISHTEEKINSDSDDAASITSQKTVIFKNLANEPNNSSITIPNSKETNVGSKDALSISSQQILTLRNLIQEPNAPLIKKCRIHFQSCDGIVGAGATSAKEQTSHVDEQTETIFQCAHCSKCFKSKKHLRRHLKYSSCKTELVECGQCSKQFNEKYSLIHHLQNKCAKQKQHMCGYCKRQFKFEKNLHYHMKRECGKINVYKCPKCQKQYLFRKNFNCHLKYKCGSRKDVKCPKCNKEFVSGMSLDQHVRNDCGRKETFSCLTCFKKYKYKRSLAWHLKYDCGRAEPHKCPQCQRLFVTKDSLNKHMKHDCGRTEPHKCPRCQKLFVTKNSLKTHMKHDCNRAEPHKCPQCQKLFVTKNSLKTHMKHDCNRAEPHKCPQCQKLFVTKNSLNRHMKHDCNRAEPHKCPQCQKLFSKKNTLYNHLKRRCSKKKL